jgi:hypothetical protein
MVRYGSDCDGERQPAPSPALQLPCCWVELRPVTCPCGSTDESANASNRRNQSLPAAAAAMTRFSNVKQPRLGDVFAGISPIFFAGLALESNLHDHSPPPPPISPHTPMHQHLLSHQPLAPLSKRGTLPISEAGRPRAIRVAGARTADLTCLEASLLRKETFKILSLSSPHTQMHDSISKLTRCAPSFFCHDLVNFHAKVRR